MDDFIAKFNKKQQDDFPDLVLKPFVGDPSLLSLAERQELIYQYQYLEETIEALATYYRVGPSNLSKWIEEKKLARVTLETEEDLEAFEEHVNKIYRSLQIRILGLTALNTAKAWQTLATSSENLLAGLETASKTISEQALPDAKMLSSLTSTHSMMVERHELIQKAMDKAGNIVSALKEKLGWEIEVTHVNAQPKTKEKS